MKPNIWAHRGASAQAPENTMAAFALAQKLGADGIELDVQLSADNNVVVFHDDDLARLCGQPGLVSQTKWSELQKLRVSGEPIPLLSEVLRAFPSLKINIELKAGRRKKRLLVREVMHLVAQHDASGRVLISSFDPLSLALVRAWYPSAKIGYLFHSGQRWPIRRGILRGLLGAHAVHPEKVLVTAESMERWKKAGVDVNVWTVDDPQELSRLFSLGVSGVFCNDPQAAQNIRDTRFQAAA